MGRHLAVSDFVGSERQVLFCGVLMSRVIHDTCHAQPKSEKIPSASRTPTIHLVAEAAPYYLLGVEDGCKAQAAGDTTAGKAAGRTRRHLAYGIGVAVDRLLYRSRRVRGLAVSLASVSVHLTRGGLPDAKSLKLLYGAVFAKQARFLNFVRVFSSAGPARLSTPGGPHLRGFFFLAWLVA